MRERRVQLGFREDPTDEPGIVLGDDGVFYEVASDGTRSRVGNGGSLPANATWDTDNLIVNDTDGTRVFWLRTLVASGTQLIVRTAAFFTDAFTTYNNNGDPLLESDPFANAGAGEVRVGGVVVDPTTPDLAAVVAQGSSAGAAITDVTDPTNPQDAATKNYVDVGYQQTSEKGQADGYASLGSDGLVPTGQLPASGVLDYVESHDSINFDVSGTPIIATGVVSFDGSTAISIEFFTRSVTVVPDGSGVCAYTLSLVEDDATVLGLLCDGDFYTALGAVNIPTFVRSPTFTPAAGTHSYSIVATAFFTPGGEDPAAGIIHGEAPGFPTYLRTRAEG